VSSSQVITNPQNVIVHVPPGAMGTKVVVSSARSQVGTTSASAAAHKLKPKEFTGISRY